MISEPLESTEIFVVVENGSTKSKNRNTSCIKFFFINMLLQRKFEEWQNVNVLYIGEWMRSVTIISLVSSERVSVKNEGDAGSLPHDQKHFTHDSL